MLPPIQSDKLLISSDFYSIQGEGKTSGVPAYFIRLSHCNLSCGVSSRCLKQIQKENKLQDGEIFVGDLEASGQATWTCDSTSQWAMRGENQDFQYLLDRWEEQDLDFDIQEGVIHLIWTGGEPTMVKHQNAIVNFFDYWEKDLGKHGLGITNVFNEIETNGTIYIKDELFGLLSQINCSPKLQNSGMSEKRRIVPEAILRIMEHKNYQFKFVISTEEDVKELFRDFVVPFNIPLQNVVCMPGLDDQSNFHERTLFVLEMAKKYRFVGLTRLHISAYNQTLNV